MSSSIEILWKQALKTFAGRRGVNFKLCPKNFEKLRQLMNKITAEDVCLRKEILDFVRIQTAHMCVIDVFENQDITIAIFILKHGVTMPMHDHPHMHGLLKVLTGVVKIDSYSLVNNDESMKLNEEVTASKHQPIIVNETDPACVLTPMERNLHEISCIEGPAAFLDILSPPYDDCKRDTYSRHCSFFRIIGSESSDSDSGEKVRLKVMDVPSDLYSRSLKYMGPPLR